jgi:hypothetical protein
MGKIIVRDYTNSVDTSDLYGVPYNPCDGSQVDVGFKSITFRDQGHTIIGTAETGAQILKPVIHPVLLGTPSPISDCDVTTTFKVTLPRATFYQVEVPGFGIQPPVAYSDVSGGFLIQLDVGT